MNEPHGSTRSFRSAELLEVYARNQQRLVSTIEELLTLPLDRQSQLDARALRSDADRLCGRPEIRRAEFAAPGGIDQFLPADVGTGIHHIESRQRAN